MAGNAPVLPDGCTKYRARFSPPERNEPFIGEALSVALTTYARGLSWRRETPGVAKV